MPRDDRSLILAMHRGHEPSGEELWARFAPRLLAYARATLPPGERDAAGDIVQTVFCTILDRPRRELKRIEDASAWLFRVARNSALNHARGERRERARREAVRASHQRGAPPSLSDLRDAANELPEEQREVVLLRHVGGLTYDQIAGALEVNRSTVASRHTAAVSALRERLAGDTMGARHAGA